MTVLGILVLSCAIPVTIFAQNAAKRCSAPANREDDVGVNCNFLITLRIILSVANKPETQTGKDEVLFVKFWTVECQPFEFFAQTFHLTKHVND